MTAPDWKPGDPCGVYYPHDGRHNTLRPGVIIGAGYTPDQRRVQYADGSTFIVHTVFLYAPGEQPTAQRRDSRAGERTQRPGPKAGSSAPRKRGLTGKRKRQVKDILRLHIKRLLETSTTPARWQDTGETD